LTLTRRAKELVIVAMLLAVPLLVLRANLKTPAQLNFLDRGILRVSAPIQAAVTWMARGVGSAWSRYVFLVGVEAENRKLGDDNARLRSEVARLQRELGRTSELEKLVGLAAHVTAPSITARVVGIETSSFFRVVRVKLDRGDDVVKPGMAVLASAGVVGRVQRVFGPYSDVLLAADPKSSIDVVVPRTGGRGVLKGIAGDNRYRTRIAYLERKDEVAEGDLVVTSGLAGIFPRDVPIGRIVKVSKKDFGLYQDAEVQPVVDFGKLRDVLIVVPRDPTPLPAPSRKEKS
jgi:rod shape-determining protein MreC